MPIKVGWYLEEKVSYIQLIGDVSTETFIEAANYRVQLMNDSSEEKIHVILDTRESTSTLDITSLSKYEVPSNNGWTMAVGTTNTVARFAGTVILQLLKQKFKFVDTLDEAIDELIEIDPLLTPKQANYDIIIRKEFD